MASGQVFRGVDVIEGEKTGAQEYFHSLRITAFLLWTKESLGCGAIPETRNRTASSAEISVLVQ